MTEEQLKASYIKCDPLARTKELRNNNPIDKQNTHNGGEGELVILRKENTSPWNHWCNF